MNCLENILLLLLLILSTTTAMENATTEADAVVVVRKRHFLPSFCHEHPQIDLPEDYNPHETPFVGFEQDGSTKKKLPVGSRYLIADISGVDDHNRVLSMNIIAYKMWTDARIKV